MIIYYIYNTYIIYNYIFIYLHNYIYVASSFMGQQSSGIYNINVYLSKKTNKVGIEHNNTRQTMFEKILPVLYIC